MFNFKFYDVTVYTNNDNQVIDLMCSNNKRVIITQNGFDKSMCTVEVFDRLYTNDNTKLQLVDCYCTNFLDITQG